MIKSPQRKSESQSAKFEAAARELGCEDNEEAFDAKLKKVASAPPTVGATGRKVQHASDCAVNNGPAYPAGPCDCGAETRSRK